MTRNSGRAGKGVIVISFIAMLVGAFALIVGLVDDDIAWIWVAIAFCVLAMVCLGIGVAAHQKAATAQGGSTPPDGGTGGGRTDTGTEGGSSGSPGQADRRNGAPDFYAIIGVSPDASEEEIRRAYRVRARLLDPDRHAGSGAEVHAEAQREMTLLNEAWETLRSSARRAAYDRMRDAQR